MGAPGEGMNQAAEEAFAYGADVVYLVEDAVLADYRNEPYSKGLTQLVNAHKPEILLLGATTLGRDLAGSVATTLLTGLTADCTELGSTTTSRWPRPARPSAARCSAPSTR